MPPSPPVAMDGISTPASDVLQPLASSQVWDVRQTPKDATPIKTFADRRSVNSAFFNATGTHLLSVTMNNTICLYEESSWAKGGEDTGADRAVEGLGGRRLLSKSGHMLPKVVTGGTLCWDVHQCTHPVHMTPCVMAINI